MAVEEERWWVCIHLGVDERPAGSGPFDFKGLNAIGPPLGRTGRSLYGRRCGYEVRRKRKYPRASQPDLKVCGNVPEDCASALLVRVEAAARLAAEGAVGDEVADALRDLHAERVADRDGDIEAHEVQQC